MCLAVVCLPAAQASAAPRLTALRALPNDIVTPVVTDGDRYAVAGLADGATRLFDTRRGTSRDVGTPSCVNPVAPADAIDTPLRFVGGGYVVWQCRTDTPGNQLIWVQDIQTNRRFVAAGTATLWSAELGSAAGSTFRVISVGRHWLYAIRSAYHSPTQDALIGVDTPRTIIGIAGHRPRDTIALDRPHGTRPLCQGITRKAGVDEAGISELPYEPLLFDRPFAVNPVNRDLRPIQACAHTPAAPRRVPVQYAQAGGRVLTWAENGTVRARTYTSRAMAVRSVKGAITGVSHTRNRVFVSVASSPIRGYVAVFTP